MTQRRKPRKYTDEFREETDKLVTEQGYTITEASKSLGITTKLLYNCKGKFAKQALDEALSKDERAELVPYSDLFNQWDLLYRDSYSFKLDHLNHLIGL